MDVIDNTANVGIQISAVEAGFPWFLALALGGGAVLGYFLLRRK